MTDIEQQTDIEQAILDIVAAEPGITYAGIAANLDDKVRRQWERAGSILRFLAHFRLARWCYWGFSCDFRSTVDFLVMLGDIREQRSWVPGRLHYFPGERR